MMGVWFVSFTRRFAMTVGIYVRVSTEEQNEAGQRRELQKWMVDNGIRESSVQWYVDKASGSTLNRPELLQLRKDIARGAIKTVVVWRLDRLSRDIRHGLKLLGDWCELGVRMVIVTQQIDVSGTMGKMIAALLLGVAQMEKENILARQRAGIEAAKERGVYRGRQPGATKAGVNPARAAELRERGFSQEEVAKAMGISISSVARYQKMAQSK
jgi:DNA invertase Pin-like site-specific DNA recombinase